MINFYYGQSNELVRVEYPFGGKIRWQYRSFDYVGNRTMREVQTRYLKMVADKPELTYSLSYPTDAADAGRSYHETAKMVDASGAVKEWTVNGARQVTGQEERESTGTVLIRREFAWTTSASGQPYIGEVVEKLNPGNPYAKWGKSTQTIDAYGNVTEARRYDYIDANGTFSDTTARVHASTYLTDAAYMDAYIRNRLVTATVRQGVANPPAITLVTNVYDFQPLCVGDLRGHGDAVAA